MYFTVTTATNLSSRLADLQTDRSYISVLSYTDHYLSWPTSNRENTHRTYPPTKKEISPYGLQRTSPIATFLYRFGSLRFLRSYGYVVRSLLVKSVSFVVVPDLRYVALHYVFVLFWFFWDPCAAESQWVIYLALCTWKSMWDYKLNP